MAIELWPLEGFTGLIIEGETGSIYTNQACGLSCGQPQTQGFYIPLLLPGLVEKTERHIAKMNGPGLDRDPWFCGYPENIPYSKEECQKALKTLEVDHLFEARENFEGDWGEAWIPVLVKDSFEGEKDHDNFWLLQDFRGRKAILTYENCD